MVYLHFFPKISIRLIGNVDLILSNHHFQIEIEFSNRSVYKLRLSNIQVLMSYQNATWYHKAKYIQQQMEQMQFTSVSVFLFSQTRNGLLGMVSKEPSPFHTSNLIFIRDYHQTFTIERTKCQLGKPTSLAAPLQFGEKAIPLAQRLWNNTAQVQS